MISAATFAAFLTAALLLAITPGPGIMYVLTRSLAGGESKEILSHTGYLPGRFAHVLQQFWTLGYTGHIRHCLPDPSLGWRRTSST